MRHHEKFDALRGIAALVVLVSHVVELYWVRLLGVDAPVARIAAAAGRHAVLVFFLLSGYLVTLSILGNVRRNGTFSPREYLAARIARIHPPLLGALAVMAVVWLVIHLGRLPGSASYGLPGDLFVMRPNYAIQPSRVVTALLMLGGLTGPNPPLWSLYFEFQLYVLALLAALALTRRGVRIACAFGALLGAIALSEHNRSFVFFALVWLAGAAGALWTSRAGAESVRGRLQPVVFGLAAGLAIGALRHPWALATVTPGMASELAQYALCALYAHAMFFSPVLDKALPPALARTGRFSYSLYVVHYPLLFLLLSFTQNWTQYSYWRAAAVSALALAAIVPFAQAFASVFERPKEFRGLLLSAFDSLGRPSRPG